MKKILLICLGIALASSAMANQVCKYEGADGRIIYANVPVKGANKLTCFGTEPPTSSKSPGNSRATSPTPANFPRVDPSTQNQRDDKRKQILQDELASELKALEQAKQEYAEGEASPEVFKTTVTNTVCQIQTMNGKQVEVCKEVPKEITRRNVRKFEDKMQRLQANVELHEKNIELLNKELSNLK